MEPGDATRASLVNRATLLAYVRDAGTVCLCEVMQRFCTSQEDACSIMGDLERSGSVEPCQDARCPVSPAAWKARPESGNGKPT